ncbi:YecA family protein [Testudinibacter sp. P80/BLE/0925]|uniref:YecA family protein n=1 Tax=Testudinibacter sp. TW-1 TaxID=3417757 RepID=UPI003D369802
MFPNENTRDESIVLKELEELCSQPGYAHVIAFFCYRDNSLFFDSDIITTEDILRQYNTSDRLLRNEISLLIGLMCKHKINLTLPQNHQFQSHINQTEILLDELHSSIIKNTINISSIEELSNILTSGKMLREPIFYGGESAYSFQYRNFSKLKYSYDNEWFIKNKGYSTEQLFKIIVALEEIQTAKIYETLINFKNQDPKEWSILEGYIFSVEDIISRTNLDEITIKNFLDSFSLQKHQNISSLKKFGDFNPTNAYPFLVLKDNRYLLFQYYSLVEAVYETPFFWFNQDSSYKNTAMEHRGKFTENISFKRLKLVFGDKNVFKNIDIKDTNNNKLGEIDVLVVFADRAIILQAKSKKLTIPARQGNDDVIKNDFEKAIQSSYEQSVSCGKLLLNNKNRLISTSGEEILLNRDFSEIYPFSVISEHYPALHTQARHFLKQTEHNVIKPAFVIDIFTLDVITELLQSPLYFLSYINRRIIYKDKLIANHELTILAYHLKSNLYLDNDYTAIHLADDLNADLDLVMQSRRANLSNKLLPDGILTKYQDTFFDKLIKNIEKLENKNVIELGLELLTLGEETISILNKNIRKVQERSLQDRKLHDLTLTFDENDTSGLTIHCTDEPYSQALNKLSNHCERRKYKHKSERWFGIAIDIDNAEVRFGINKIYTWKPSYDMDIICRELFSSSEVIVPINQQKRKRKIGRNAPCPCGSGKKYKKCCCYKQINIINNI